jgi:Asp-tRNA(Asn)/Glu-tRNA(Gln) amidotransferase A subunit family amidase
MSVNGPITRSVGDAALMFAAMVGPDPRDPLALPDTGEDWAAVVDGASVRGLRAAWTPDLGGAAPMDPTVAGVARAAAQAFGELGCPLDDASPEIGDLQQPFTVLNAGLRQATLGAYLDKWRDQMDPVLVTRIELSHGFSAVDVGRAELARSQYHHRLCHFFEQYDLLLLPATATPPLPLGTLFPPEIAGRPIAQHLDMLVPTFAFNFSCFPAISVPAGVTDEGLPIGLQIVGGWQQDALVLRAAAAFEAARPWNDHRPPLD